MDYQAGLLKARKPKSNEKLRLKSVAIPIDAPVATKTDDSIAQIGSGYYNSRGAPLNSPQLDPMLLLFLRHVLGVRYLLRCHFIAFKE
jgi:hypothetical protein